MLMLIQLILCYCLQTWFVCLFVCLFMGSMVNAENSGQPLVCWKGQFGKRDGTEIWKAISMLEGESYPWRTANPYS